jgi:hypothetical protein
VKVPRLFLNVLLGLSCPRAMLQVRGDVIRQRQASSIDKPVLTRIDNALTTQGGIRNELAEDTLSGGTIRGAAGSLYPSSGVVVP